MEKFLHVFFTVIPYRGWKFIIVTAWYVALGIIFCH